MADILIYEVLGSDIDNLYVQKTELNFDVMDNNSLLHNVVFDGEKHIFKTLE